MFLSQYAYFALYSVTTSAAEVTAALGIDPDEITVRGSRFTEPKVVPAIHRWKIVCREPGMSVDEQIARVVARLAPHVEPIAALARQLNTADGHQDRSGALLGVVRRFNDEEGQDRLTSAPPELIDGPDLLGWHLGRDVLDFLHATGAELDIDEYDYTSDPDDD